MWFGCTQPYKVVSLLSRSNICSVLAQFTFIKLWRALYCIMRFLCQRDCERSKLTIRTKRSVFRNWLCSALPDLSEIRVIFYEMKRSKENSYKLDTKSASNWTERIPYVYEVHLHDIFKKIKSLLIENTLKLFKEMVASLTKHLTKNISTLRRRNGALKSQGR
jgi:hypothetical protein